MLPLNLIAKEMAGEVSPEKFIEVYDYIMSDEEDRHMFMFIDLHKKDNHPSMFCKKLYRLCCYVSLQPVHDELYRVDPSGVITLGDLQLF